MILALVGSLLLGGCNSNIFTKPANPLIEQKVIDEIYYDNDTKVITFNLYTGIYAGDARKFQELLQFCRVNKVVRLDINICSYGGEVFPMWAIIDHINAIKKLGIEVHTYGYGFAASASALIFIMGDKRFIAEQAWFMIHPHSAALNTSGSESEQLMFQEWSVRYAKIVSEASKLSFDEVMEMLKGSSRQNTNYFCATECIALGIAHEIIK